MNGRPVTAALKAVPVLLVALALTGQAPVRAQSGPDPGGNPAVARVAVDLELILMADCSGSIDRNEFLLQRQGYARALRDPAIIRAIEGGILGRIALSYVEWSGPVLQVPVIDWTVIGSAAEIEAFAKILEEHPRTLYGGGTAVGDAITYGALSIARNGFEGTRRVIDVSGDGPDRNGMPAAQGRAYAVAQGMTVNGLPILAYDGDPLEGFFRDHVIGGPGAFYVAARGFEDFYTAVRRKLILEIAGTPEAAIRAAALPPGSPSAER